MVAEIEVSSRVHGRSADPISISTSLEHNDRAHDIDNEHANGKAEPIMTNGHTKPSKWIPIREEVVYKPTRRLRVVSIGAGFSGKSPGRESSQAILMSVAQV